MTPKLIFDTIYDQHFFFFRNSQSWYLHLVIISLYIHLHCEWLSLPSNLATNTFCNSWSLLNTAGSKMELPYVKSCTHPTPQPGDQLYCPAVVWKTTRNLCSMKSDLYQNNVSLFGCTVNRHTSCSSVVFLTKQPLKKNFGTCSIKLRLLSCRQINYYWNHKGL